MEIFIELIVCICLTSSALVLNINEDVFEHTIISYILRCLLAIEGALMCGFLIIRSL